MEFKVGDRVRFIENSMLHEGIIIKNCGRWDGYLYNNYLVKSMIGEFNILAPSLVLDNCINEAKSKDLEQRIEKLEKRVIGEQNSLEKRENEPIYERNERLAKILKKELERNAIILNEPKPSLLTEDERVILRNFNKTWKWIARDKYGGLYAYNEKPEKKDIGWMNVLGNFCAIDFLLIDLFQFIKWTDKEPYNIEELLKGECGNE